MVKSIVYNQETVMDTVCGFYLDRRVLTVMPVDTLTECAAYLAGVYKCRHTCVSVVELNQHGFINIIVNQNNPIIRSLDKTANKLMGVKYLSVEEYSFFWREGCADEEINLVSQIIEPFIMFQQASVNAALHVEQSLIDAITAQEIIFQYFVCPDSELDSTLGFYPISNRQ